MAVLWTVTSSPTKGEGTTPYLANVNKFRKKSYFPLIIFLPVLRICSFPIETVSNIKPKCSIDMPCRIILKIKASDREEMTKTKTNRKMKTFSRR